MPKFQVVSEYQPSGDQPEAIAALAEGIENGLKEQVLLGVTGSGKTFTMAKVIEAVQRPALVLAHNKTLAAQLCAEFKEFFPNNAVEYFVSYYDYYQPEAYIPHTDTYIAKDASTNDEIDRLRLSATFALLERRDVIVVASVSCIYGLGEPEDFAKLSVSLRAGAEWNRDELLRRLVEIRYERNDIAFERNMFRVRGDTVEIYPAYYKDRAIRVEFFGDEIDRISEFSPITGAVNLKLNHIVIYPASHYVTTKDKMDRAIAEIRRELEEQVRIFTDNNQLVEAQRIRQRTEYDVEMMQELGYCSGIENYSRVISERPVGSAPMTLLDFFPEDFVLFVDESHVTLPQVRAMYNGDHARKDALVRYGFRLPCAYDNRPLKFEEFEGRVGQAVFVSATPGPYERERADQVVEQVIRPTGLLDPRVEIRPVAGQIDDLMEEIRARSQRKERVLVTTLTKKMAEDLTEYFKNAGIRVRYMHSDVQTIERMEIIRDLRLGEFDVLVGINLLREGLDLPEVSLVAILDADKEGFLRSETSLIQTIGRAARNAEGLVVMYADEITPSMRAAMDETERRRGIQDRFNQEHGIVPRTIIKGVREVLEISSVAEDETLRARKKRKLSQQEREAEIKRLEKEMREASKMLEFEYAAVLRDRIIELRGEK
ncbi:excinuclease ABC subunit UvrB [Oscillibacter sp. 1-3]|uniref:excinuclease ABC subunit UvrB n=1 Tax=Oscillibacter sp. 1-3 TaxID=1235797 RepID=UPI00033E0BEC|nr:excinuclease ABC subunit UvrB [Oscillibacter sp. 1-3]EOS65971.1 excinuclease ABC subunit B [Oscillibacter sp. 1-3]